MGLGGGVRSNDLRAKNFHNRSKFDKVLTKKKFSQVFLRHGVHAVLTVKATISHCSSTLSWVNTGMGDHLPAQHLGFNVQ